MDVHRSLGFFLCWLALVVAALGASLAARRFCVSGLRWIGQDSGLGSVAGSGEDIHGWCIFAAPRSLLFLLSFQCAVVGDDVGGMPPAVVRASYLFLHSVVTCVAYSEMPCRVFFCGVLRSALEVQSRTAVQAVEVAVFGHR